MNCVVNKLLSEVSAVGLETLVETVEVNFSNYSSTVGLINVANGVYETSTGYECYLIPLSGYEAVGVVNNSEGNAFVAFLKSNELTAGSLAPLSSEQQIPIDAITNNGIEVDTDIPEDANYLYVMKKTATQNRLPRVFLG